MSSFCENTGETGVRHRPREFSLSVHESKLDALKFLSGETSLEK